LLHHGPPLTQVFRRLVPFLVRELPLDHVRAVSDFIEDGGGGRAEAVRGEAPATAYLRAHHELRAAEWPEIDLERAEWRVPAGRMKMRESHIVPLSRQALELLRELHTLTGGQRCLFLNHPPGNVHDGNDPEPLAGTHGLQRQGHPSASGSRRVLRCESSRRSVP